MTGEGARAYLGEQDIRVREAANVLRTRPEDLIERLKALVDEKKVLEKQLSDAKRQIALGGGGSGAAGIEIKAVGGLKLYLQTTSGFANNELKSLADDGKAKIGSGIVVIANNAPDGKAGLVVAVTNDWVKTWSAVDLVKIGAEALGGKGGGGRADMAQAGGPDGAKAGDALSAIEARLAQS